MLVSLKWPEKSRETRSGDSNPADAGGAREGAEHSRGAGESGVKFAFYSDGMHARARSCCARSRGRSTRACRPTMRCGR